jgi:hypothetical protein
MRIEVSDKEWRQLIKGAFGVATAISGPALLMHYLLGYRLFEGSGLSAILEAGYGWFTLLITILGLSVIFQLLSKNVNRIPPVVQYRRDSCD